MSFMDSPGAGVGGSGGGREGRGAVTGCPSCVPLEEAWYFVRNCGRDE